MNKVYIVAACRTPVGRFLGALKTVSAVELAALTVRHNLKQAGIDPAWIDEVICGCVLAAGQGMGPARQVALRAGIPVQKPAYTLNMICGSGMKSLTEGAIHIQSGYADLVVAGGMENMSQAPFLLRGEIRGGMKFGAFSSEDVIQRDGLTDPLLQIPMGETAEAIAAQEQISRAAQDQYALESHHKASAASRAGYFADEMVPVTVSAKRGVSTVREDEPIRHDLSAEQLAALKPAFRADGSVTAGNASGLNDGAASVILASARAVARYGLQPLAEIVSFGEGGVDPSMMGLGPLPAIACALRRGRFQLSDMARLEINEAFAAQVLGVVKGLARAHQMTEEEIASRLNVHGGAIALGHPLGSSGTRIVVSLVHALRRENQPTGLASLCIGGGMGIALLVKTI
ncbi:acetyl-CoA C-acyltransferase [Klebsiella quasipneumoniae]|uniref:acetyl-CoA C-acyltransferase n=1 Tax=Klebsiella quasipneumoniae TaxID=1463165 RepID=UPI000D748ED7|nr:acetyl-CoA C-acyltransferase [Klebsiella quasipneumoniae]PXI47944.1 acetyl-CoA C-acyltransferase [Klebsiella quasipneumoniae]